MIFWCGRRILWGRRRVIRPIGTEWEGGTFRLQFVFTEDYPTKAPQVRFITKMFHPNIYTDGKICLDTLQKNWTPGLTITSVLISIQSLLSDPNPMSPANNVAAQIYQQDRAEYNRKVLENVEMSWAHQE
jgi:ubiquitin-protein ligase